MRVIAYYEGTLNYLCLQLQVWGCTGSRLNIGWGQEQKIITVSLVANELKNTFLIIFVCEITHHTFVNIWGNFFIMF